MKLLLRLHSLSIMVALAAMIGGAETQAQCLDDWLYRMPITITNPNPSTLTDFQVALSVNTIDLIGAGKMTSDGRDIRFISNPDGGCTQVCHWVERDMGTGNTRIWVKVPNLSASGSTTIYMYYGNPAAASISNTSCVFDFFDGFDGLALDGADWAVNGNGGGTVTVGSGVLQFNVNGTGRTARTVRSFTPPVVSEMMVSSANGNWPNMAQHPAGTWEGYAVCLGGATQYLDRTVGSGGHYSMYLGQSIPASGVVGVWSLVWIATGNIVARLPAGTMTRTTTDYPLPSSVTVAIGGLDGGTAQMTVDWFRVRKFASQDPTGTFGPEEIIEPPVIITHPQNVRICPGDPAVFTVTAEGRLLSYQWRKDGIPIPGATESTYSIPVATPAHAGVYDVVISNRVTSNPATLSLDANPEILTNPVSQTVCPGTPVIFTVEGRGSGITYQWRRDGTPIEGATGTSYIIPSASVEEMGNYDVVVTAICGEPAISEAANFNMYVATEITSQPADQAVCRGEFAVFSVTTNGTDVTYQWRKNGEPIEGATEPTLTIYAEPYKGGVYDVMIMGRCQPAPVMISNPAQMSVVLDPIITDQPIDRTVRLGQTVTFRVRTMGGGALSYQWQRDGLNLPGETNDFITVQNVTVEDLGDYNVVIRGTQCATTPIVSNKASLLIDAPPAVIKSPENVVTCAGGSASFTVTATGAGLTYQWRKNGTDIPGKTSRDLLINNITSADAGSYDVVVRSGNETLNSSAATLTVQAPAAISTQPADVTVCPGDPANFNVGATGDGLLYQWRKNGDDINGATSAGFSIATATAADTGTYSVMIMGACTDSLISQTVRLQLNQATLITQGPENVRVAPGGTATFTVTATGTGITYQWRKDGVTIPGATGSSYSITAARLEDAGKYDVIVSGACDPADTSAQATLTVSTSSVPNDPAIAGAMLKVVPQPAHGQTRLEIVLPQGVRAGSGAELMLYDMHGKAVLNLSESFAQGGYRGAEFDASGLSSGVYYCRLSTGTWNGTLGTIVVEK